jgi:hypothetical protein
VHTKHGLKLEAVQAVRWVGGNLNQMSAFAGASARMSRYSHHGDSVLLPRPDNGGAIAVALGQWAVRTESGAIYVMADWAFSEDYERVSGPDELR